MGTPMYILVYMTATTNTIKCANGITYEVISAKPYNHKGNDRMWYTAKRPNGKRTYMIVGYENGTFSTAA